MIRMTEGLGPVGPLVATILLGCTTVLLLLWYSLQRQSYWKKLGVPYVNPIPFIGCVLDFLLKPAHEVELHRYNKYGRIYGHYEGNSPLLSVAEPQMLRDVLVKDFQAFPNRRLFDTGDKILQKTLFGLRGEDWKRVRSIVSPTFTTGKIKRMVAILSDCAQTLVKNFRKAAEKSEPVELKSIYGTFTMDVIASSAFSTKIDSQNDPDNEFVKTAQLMFKKRMGRFLAFLAFPRLMKFLGIGLSDPKCMKFFTDVTVQIMEERKKMGQTRNDFLQLLMDTAKEASDEEKSEMTEKDSDIAANYGGEDNNSIFKTMTSKKTLSIEELVAQCVIFFLAGYDTTATTISFATYLLALHPEVQKELFQEVEKALKEHKGELTYEAVQSMKLLDNVISETLRLYPPGLRLERRADQDYKLADTGIIIPKGMIITIPIYGMHRDPKLFSDPEKFYPSRWLPEERAKRDSYSYLPFGAGPRNCVAMRFALMEVKVCLAHVIHNFKIKRCSKTQVPIEFVVQQSAFANKGIYVLFESREDIHEV